MGYVATIIPPLSIVYHPFHVSPHSESRVRLYLESAYF